MQNFVRDFVGWISRVGVQEGLTSIEQRRIILVNRVVMVSMVVSLLLVLINLSSGLILQMFVNLTSIAFVLIPVFVLHHFHRYLLARSLLFFGIVVLVTWITYHNLLNGRYVQNEITLVGLSVLIVILYTGNLRRWLFIGFILWIFAVEYVKFQLLGQPIGSDYVFTILNISIFFVCIYFFTAIFRQEIYQHADEVFQLNAKLEDRSHQLEKAKFMLDSMINHLPVFLAMLDREGRYVVANSRYEGAFQLPANKIIGHHYSQVLPMEMIARHDGLINRCFEAEELDFYEEITLPSGEKTNSYGKYYPVKNEQGAVEYVTVFVTDITEVKNVERQLNELNKTKDKLFSIMAHDLRSPINTLMGVLHINEKRELSQEEFMKYVGRVRENLAMLSHMLDNLLHWAMSQQQGMKTQLKRVILNKLFQEQVSLYAPMADQKRINLTCEEQDTFELIADENHLRLILRNLVNNALKFTPEGGKVSLKLAGELGVVTFSVKDTGVGMSEETIEKLLAKKPQTSTYGTAGESGTGLGVSLCLEVCQLNGWDMTITSEPDKGSTFLIKLEEGS